MAYATGSATTTANLMDAIVAFAAAQLGATEAVRRTETISSISRTVVCLQKGSSYWWFYWSSNEVRGMPATGSGGATWAAVTGRPTNDTRLRPIAEPFTSYHLFSDGTVVHAAIEMSGGWWQHLSFGDVTKVGSWTGGHYVCLQNAEFGSGAFNTPTSVDHEWLFRSLASSFSTSFSSGEASFMYVPYNGKNYAAMFGSTTNHASYNNVSTTGFASELVTSGPVDQTPNAFNNRSPGFPVQVFLRDNQSGGSNLSRMLGSIPGVRIINIKNLNAKDLINTDWMVFPMQSKNLGSSGVFANSGNYGVAFKK